MIQQIFEVEYKHEIYFSFIIYTDFIRVGDRAEYLDSETCYGN